MAQEGDFIATSAEPKEQRNGDTLADIAEATEQRISEMDFSPAEIRKEASFDMDTTQGQILWIKAQNEMHADLVDRGEFYATITDWVCWQKDVVRQNGEIEQNAWVACWFTDDGKSLSTASALTVNQWAAIVRSLRKGKLALPLTCRFTPNKKPGTNKTPWYSIVPKGE
jgi:hypothetical protein